LTLSDLAKETGIPMNTMNAMYKLAESTIKEKFYVSKSTEREGNIRYIAFGWSALCSGAAEYIVWFRGKTKSKKAERTE
jgi:hypothetical protein